MAIIDGTEGNDSLVGGIGADTLNGLGGNDTLLGDFGDDLLDGGTGNDSLDGAYGNDTLLGGDGTDTLLGSFGDDSLTGGLGADNLDAGDGNDTLVGDAGNNTLSGGAGNDSLTGGDDHDNLNGGAGSDTLYGGLGNDTLTDNAGGGGVNQLFGEVGNDSLYGYGYPGGTFTLSGGDGNDTLYVEAGSGVLNGDAGNDNLSFRGEGSQGHAATLSGGSGHDTITVSYSPLASSIDGGDGNDYLAHAYDYSARNDTYIGGTGNDTIIDSAGANSINAGDDADTVVYGGWGGADTIDLGSGNDTIQNLNATYAASITTGTGQDLLVIKAFSTSANNLTTISDFTPGAGGDVVDILAVLQSISTTGWDGSSNPFASGFLRLVQSGADTLLQLDTTGAANGAQWVNLLTFRNMAAGDFGYANLAQDLPNSAPTDIALSVAKVAENAANGTIVGTLSATDFDIAFGEAVTFSLLDSAGGRFAVSGGDLVVANGALLDRETNLTHTVTVRVTDSHGASYDETFVISLTNQPGVTIVGTAGDDRVNRSVTAAGQPLPTGEEDSISGDDGQDTLAGEGGNDTIIGGPGNDSLTGGAGRDHIHGDDGNDTISGGFGNDSLEGGEGDDDFLVQAAGGIDAYIGGNGFDRILSTASNVNIQYSLMSGIEAISASSHTEVRIVGSAVSETLDFSAITLTGIAAIDGGNGKDTILGSAGADTIVGGYGNDSLDGGDGDDTFLFGTASGIDAIIGGAGNDRIAATADNANIAFNQMSGIETIDGGGFANVRISGTAGPDLMDFSSVTLSGIAAIQGGNSKDTITGSMGDDTIVGGNGQDLLSGGAGADTFLFSATWESARSTPDTIIDFVHGTDRIDLSAIDGDGTGGAINAFAWIGSGAFTRTAGELRYALSGGNTVVQGDTNGDGVADIQIVLTGTVTLDAGDFLL